MRFSADEFFVRKGGVYPRLRRFGVLGRKSTAPPEAWAGLVTAAPKQSRTKDKRRRGGAAGGGAQRATPLVAAPPRRHARRGVPLSRLSKKTKEESRREAPLYFFEDVACGETAGIPFWVGSGASPREHKYLRPYRWHNLGRWALRGFALHSLT